MSLSLTELTYWTKHSEYNSVQYRRTIAGEATRTRAGSGCLSVRGQGTAGGTAGVGCGGMPDGLFVRHLEVEQQQGVTLWWAGQIAAGGRGNADAWNRRGAGSA